MISVDQIASIVHNVNRAIQAANEEPQDPAWHWLRADDYRRASTRRAVQAQLAGEAHSPEEQHEAWRTERLAQGWRYGPTKDTAARTNPALVPYPELPALQRLKDTVRVAIVEGLRDATLPQTYPPGYEPTTWASKEAAAILDMITPGVLPLDVHMFLYGAIIGLAIRLAKEGPRDTHA